MKNLKCLSACLMMTSALSLPEIAAAQVSDEIIVTATRRVESLQDVPIAVTAISPDDLEKQGVVNIQNLTSVAPSFSTSQAQSNSGTVVLRIRGVGTTSNNIGFESAVGVFIDGAYQSRPGIALNEFVDVERLEVLRGPQGTLFGRNTSAGALNIINVRPDLSEAGGFVNASYGNFDHVSLQGALNFPLVEDRLGVRFTGAYRNRDGFVDLIDSNGDSLGDSNDADQVYFRGQLGFDEKGVKGRVVVDYSESDSVCCAAIEVLRSDAEAAGVFTAVGLGPRGGQAVENFNDDPFDNDAAEALIDDRITTQNFRPNPSSEQIGIVGELEIPLGNNVDLIYIGSYREYEAIENSDSGFSGLDVFNILPSQLDIDTLTQELRVQGEALDGRLSWLVGGFYSEEDINSESNLENGDDFDALVGAVFGGAVGPAPLALFTGTDPADVNVNSLFTQDASSWSIFTHNIFEVTDQFNLTFGLRYTDESKTGAFLQPAVTNDTCPAAISNAFLGAVPPGAAPLAPFGPGLGGGVFALGCFAFTAPADLPTTAFGIPTPTTFSEDFEDDELIWTVKAGYELTPNINTYASFTHGFKAGGLNLDSTAAIPNPTTGISDPSFASEEVDAFEIGVKSKLWDDRITLNVAGFFEDFSNFQVLEFTGTQFVTFNVPNAESIGVEIEGTLQATDNLLINGGLTYLQASYPDDCAGALTAVNVLALCGEDLTNAPRTVGILGATYSGDFGNSFGYFLNGQVRYEGDRRTSTQAIILPDQADVDAALAAGTLDDLLGAAAPLPFDVQESTFKLNLRGGITNEEAGVSLEVWANNLTDQVTRGVTISTPLRAGARTAFIQQPRTFGATIRKNF